MEEAVYPIQVKTLLVLITDERGRIVATNTFTDTSLGADKSFRLSIPKDTKGELFCTIWANPAKQDYKVAPKPALANDLSQYTLEAITAPKGVLFQKVLTPLYFAKETLGAMPEHKNLRAPFVLNKEINLIRYSNDFTFGMTGLPKLGRYRLEIKDENLAYGFDGLLTKPHKNVIYRAEFPGNEGDFPVSFELSTLRLNGVDTKPILTIEDLTPLPGQKETMIVKGDDLKKLLLLAPNYNLACYFKHSIRYVFKGAGTVDGKTHYAVEIYVQDWKVHSYDVVL